MADQGKTPEELKHELANAEQEKRALQHLLKRATKEIDELVESDCEESAKQHAAEVSQRLRRALEL